MKNKENKEKKAQGADTQGVMSEDEVVLKFEKKLYFSDYYSRRNFKLTKDGEHDVLISITNDSTNRFDHSVISIDKDQAKELIIELAKLI